MVVLLGLVPLPACRCSHTSDSLDRSDPPAHEGARVHRFKYKRVELRSVFPFTHGGQSFHHRKEQPPGAESVGPAGAGEIVPLLLQHGEGLTPLPCVRCAQEKRPGVPTGEYAWGLQPGTLT